jgi:3',5'-cyclic-nucleotide phosphodiesterase
VLDEVLAVDAGSLTSGLEVRDQARLQACLVSHAHLDHIRDLATLADNRCQLGCPPLIIAGTRETLHTLQRHFFNDIVWPDFTKIPASEEPTIAYLELEPERPTVIAGRTVRAVMVSHTIDAAAFVVEGPDGAIAYSGDTGPTERLWEVLNEQRDLRALLMEVSFPDREQRLATASGHHTPRTLGIELQKYRAPKDLPTLLYHIKPVFQSEVERECAALSGLNMHVLQIQDHFVL